MVTSNMVEGSIGAAELKLLESLGYGWENGHAVSLPATRKVGAVKELEMKHVQEHLATRGKIFGSSITAVIRWCGVDKWEFAQVRKMLLEMGCSTIADTTVRIQLTAGRKCDLRRGDAATLSDYQSKILRKAGGVVR